MRSRASETLPRTERPADWQRTHLALRFRLATPARIPGSSELREGSALGTYISLEHTELREILHSLRTALVPFPAERETDQCVICTHTHSHTLINTLPAHAYIHTAAHPPHTTASGALQFQLGGRGGALVSPARRGFSNVESGGEEGPLIMCGTFLAALRRHARSPFDGMRVLHSGNLACALTYLLTCLLAVLGSRELTVRALVRRRASLPLLSRLSEMDAWITGAR